MARFHGVREKIRKAAHAELVPAQAVPVRLDAGQRWEFPNSEWPTLGSDETTHIKGASLEAVVVEGLVRTVVSSRFMGVWNPLEPDLFERKLDLEVLPPPKEEVTLLSSKHAAPLMNFRFTLVTGIREQWVRHSCFERFVAVEEKCVATFLLQLPEDPGYIPARQTACLSIEYVGMPVLVNRLALDLHYVNVRDVQ